MLFFVFYLIIFCTQQSNKKNNSDKGLYSLVMLTSYYINSIFKIRFWILTLFHCTCNSFKKKSEKSKLISSHSTHNRTQWCDYTGKKNILHLSIQTLHTQIFPLCFSSVLPIFEVFLCLALFSIYSPHLFVFPSISLHLYVWKRHTNLH